MNLTLLGSGAAAHQGFVESATQYHELGAEAITPDGRHFRYVQAGASALVRGDVQQAPAADVDHDDIACRATAIGATELLITTGASGGALDANEYAGGYAIIDTTPGLGQICRILNHAAIAASTNGSLFVAPEDALLVALTTSSKITLIKNPYDGVIQNPASTMTGAGVGVAIYAITAAYYGWIQTKGVAPVLVGGTPAVGSAVVIPGDTAGEVVVDGAASATQVVGANMIVGRDGKVSPVLINFP